MIQVIKNKINSIKLRLQIVFLRISNLFSKTIGINLSEGRDKKIIVSLTSYPKRFNVVYLTIETLLNQTYQPDKIILWLAKDEIKEIPNHIKRLEKRGLEIRIVDENIKSYNKLFYAISEFKNDIIITVDDDIIYPKWLIEILYKKYLKFPNCIISYRCTIMQLRDKNTLMPYLLWKEAKNIEIPSYNLFFTGVGGVLYPPNSLHEEVLNKNIFLQLSPTADDVWFKAMSLKKDTKVMQVFKNCIEFPIINGSQDDALWKINNGHNKNDEQLKKVFDKYHLYSYINKEFYNG